MITENMNQNPTMNKQGTDRKLKYDNKDKSDSFDPKKDKDIGTTRHAEESVVKPHDSPKSTERTSQQSNRL